MELLLGCGHSRIKRLYTADPEWHELVTLDHTEGCHPDVIWDLNLKPWPFLDDQFDEVHAYEVLEHLGKQGDAAAFFNDFHEIWRILKPNGLFFGSSPTLSSHWLWGDPSHTRVISRESLTFLDQDEYPKQLGKTSMTDFRSIWKGNLRLVDAKERGASLCYILQAVK